MLTVKCVFHIQLCCANIFWSSKHLYWYIYISTYLVHKEVLLLNKMELLMWIILNDVEEFVLTWTKCGIGRQQNLLIHLNSMEWKNRAKDLIENQVWRIKINSTEQTATSLFISAETELCHRTFLVHFSITSKYSPLSGFDFLFGGAYASLQWSMKVVNENVSLLGCSCRSFFHVYFS